MKIGIVTQQLRDNYGGILQNWALQRVLKQIGHEPITIDWGFRVPVYKYILSQIKKLIYLLLGKKYRSVRFGDMRMRMRMIDNFVSQKISLTHSVDRYTNDLVERYYLDAVIVGSDQVWRPMYNWQLEDMYLRFVKKDGVIKMAYAASFGSNKWEYSDEQTKCCMKYAKQMNAISVREMSGVDLCEKYLDVNATFVLDPTLLLKKTDYEELCKEIPKKHEPTISAYILDLDESLESKINTFSKQNNLNFELFRAHGEATLTIEDWLAKFRDAQYIITDSFHGVVFSILFNKQFVCVGNKDRGEARFESLLKLVKLEDRMDNTLNNFSIVKKPINWQQVNAILENKKLDSFIFLKKYLN